MGQATSLMAGFGLPIMLNWKLFDQPELLDAVRNAVGMHQGAVGGRDRID